ncbi:MAG TPA: CHAT domain-containing tetratricopeptide repeat protein [Pyrinomonadaceae bacterium]
MLRCHQIVLILFAAGYSSLSAYATTQLEGHKPETIALVSPQAVSQDDRRQLAEKAVAEGKQLETKGDADSLRKALEKFETALALRRALADRQAEAETLSYIGGVYYFLNEKQKSLDAFQQELQLWRAIGDHPKETAQALNNIGVVSGALGLPQKSIEAYQEALPLLRAAGDRAAIAVTLDNIGLFYLYAGELQKGLDYISEALPLYQALNLRPGIANALNNIGGVYFTWGDYRKALEYFGQALEMRRALGQRREEAMALNNIGSVYNLLGEAQKALDYHRQALELRRTLGDRAAEAASLNNMGLVYDWLGEQEKALENFQQALALFRATSDRNGEAAALINIGWFYQNKMLQPRTALDYYNQALEIRRALGQRIEEGRALENIGFIYNKLGDPRKALEYHRQALDIERASGDRLGEAASLNSIGDAQAAMGESQTALDYFSQALRLSRTVGIRNREAVALYGIATEERKRGNLAEARLRIEELLKMIESLRGTVASQELRASFLAGSEDYYEFYTDLLMRLHQREPSKGYDLAALEASERARARSLLELLAEARIDVEQGIAPELKQRERALYSRIAWIQNQLIGAYSQAKPDQTRIATLEDDMKKADTTREQLNAEIRQKSPRYADLQYPAPLGLKSIQSLLDDRTVLLEYALGKDVSFLFAVTRRDFQVARLPSASTIAGQVEALRSIISSRPQRSTVGKQINSSRELYRELIEPAGKLLNGKEKIIIVPSGALHYLPFEALLSSGEERTLTTFGASAWPYLVRDYAISYVQSAGVLASLRSRRETSARPSKTFLAFADPVYGNETGTEASFVRSRLRGTFGDQQTFKLERLVESRREVSQIASLNKPDQVSLFLGSEAREENVKTAGRLSQYRFIHFATHGLLNEERPQYSGLILSLSNSGVPASASDNLEARPGAGAPQSTLRNPQAEDGLLQVYEVFNLRLNADLVVLSACETGLGKEVKGEGLVGLTNAFLYAGTPSVVVSVWKIQDRSTADLMVKLYKEMNRGQDKTEALRQAKLALIRDRRFAHPYYWAPFILIGDPK